MWYQDTHQPGGGEASPAGGASITLSRSCSWRASGAFAPRLGSSQIGCTRSMACQSYKHFDGSSGFCNTNNSSSVGSVLNAWKIFCCVKRPIPRNAASVAMTLKSTATRIPRFILPAYEIGTIRSRRPGQEISIAPAITAFKPTAMHAVVRVRKKQKGSVAAWSVFRPAERQPRPHPISVRVGISGSDELHRSYHSHCRPAMHRRPPWDGCRSLVPRAIRTGEIAVREHFGSRGLGRFRCWRPHLNKTQYMMIRQPLGRGEFLAA